MEDVIDIQPRRCCPHPFDGHLIIALDDPLDGGVAACPDCECVATWSPAGRPAPALDRAAMLELRRAVLEQNG
jgi:hypothetical protein